MNPVSFRIFQAHFGSRNGVNNTLKALMNPETAISVS
jgi:hypothetical protein